MPRREVVRCIGMLDAPCNDVRGGAKDNLHLSRDVLSKSALSVIEGGTGIHL